MVKSVCRDCDLVSASSPAENLLQHETYADEEVTIRAMEVRNAHDHWERLRVAKSVIQLLGELRLRAHGLQEVAAHLQDTSLAQVVLCVEGVVGHQNNVIEGAVGVDQIATEALVTLHELPQEGDRLWSPCKRLVRTNGVVEAAGDLNTALAGQIHELWSGCYVLDDRESA